MTNKKTLIYIITHLAIFIPTPPYIAYGLILLLEINIVYMSAMFYSLYITTLPKKYKYPLLLIVAGVLTLLFHQGLTLFSPVIALTLGFVIYLVPLSVIPFDTFNCNNEGTTFEKRKRYFKYMARLNILTLLFFVVRELLAFGSISYPTTEGIIKIQLPIIFYDGFSFFWSSIPGTIVVLTIFMILIPSLSKDKPKIEEEAK